MKIKENLHRAGAWLSEGLRQIVKQYPVELLLALYVCVGCILIYKHDWPQFEYALCLVPIFFFALLAINILTAKTRWRWLYWIVWLSIIPLSFWSGLSDWWETESAGITCVALLPLLLLLCRRALRNELFVEETIRWIGSAVVALFFSNVALGLFVAIFRSTTYIFGIEGVWVYDVTTYALIIAETLLVPVLFLMTVSRWKTDEQREPVGFWDALMNYLLAPAVLIYTAILYLYMVKILVTWSLPEGGVAYLVFGFTLFTLAVKAFQSTLGRRMYDCFFERFSLIALPTQILFWIGAMRRVSEYGLTPPRIYLLVCGGLMTLCVLFFLSRHMGRYLYICMVAFVVAAALAYIPAMHPNRLALRSQTARATRIARSLDRLDADGYLIVAPVPLADTVRKEQWRRLYQSLDYMNGQMSDSLFKQRFGIKFNDFADALFPEAILNDVEFVRFHTYVLYGWDDRDTTVDTPPAAMPPIDWTMPDDAEFAIDNTYSRYRTNIGCECKNDSLYLYWGNRGDADQLMGKIEIAQILRQQLKKSDYNPQSGEDPTRQQLLQLLDYRDKNCRILFNEMSLERHDSVLTLYFADIHAVMLP